MSGVDLGAVRAAAERQAERVTPGIEDMAAHLDRTLVDQTHREVLGPLRNGSGASGVIMHRGETVASWGDPTVPEMAFSVSKTALSMVAGLAFDRGLLTPEDIVGLLDPDTGTIAWQHLLQQTSQWTGELWGKPAEVDRTGASHGRSDSTAPGSGWAYNDVRVNLLALALTLRLERSLPDVLGEDLLGPLGASSSWSWHGYRNSVVTVDGAEVPVVSGGAHWGGGLWMSAEDLALLGLPYLGSGHRPKQRLLSAEWIARSWRPCPIRPDYGYLWWLNDGGLVFPDAPHSGRCARGNADRHLLWVDPARELVIASHWGDDVAALLTEVSAAIHPD